MTTSRWAALAAIAFAIMFIAGTVLTGDSPGGDAANQQVAQYWNDTGHQFRALASGYLEAIAGVSLLAFATMTFRSRQDSVLAAIARNSSILAAAGIAIGGSPQPPSPLPP